MPETATPLRLHVTVTGVVQGVGFRPFVYDLARTHKLSGFVRNRNDHVEMEVQGTEENISRFMNVLKHKPPPRASIIKLRSRSIDPEPDAGFEITASVSCAEKREYVPPDSATCDECLAELFDRHNRRYRYPFVNCTNCGPRFTIIRRLPYDRPATTMAQFQMCCLCRQEYEDPTDRRFHAQPNACADCGPELHWSSSADSLYGESALQAVLTALDSGKIIALKGLGGFHLICDATNKSAVDNLRERKQRAGKPFALMMGDIETIRRHCVVSAHEEIQLRSPARPVVLLDRRSSCNLPESIAPGINRLGIMLPYTPLHHLVLHDFARPIVATSANISEEPICTDIQEAESRLAAIASGFLDHNRPIHSRYDDSVIQCINDAPAVLRRSRGFAPLPVTLPFRAERVALGCGGHLKNTFCFARDNQALISQHIGDLENIETEDHFQQSLETYKQLFGLEPELLACDLHPDYASTAIAEHMARAGNLPLIRVQHHHAHIAACMVEHGITREVIGVALDGSGYGTDGTLWGGEFLAAALNGCRRLGHLRKFPMPGGELAVKQPWRMALGCIDSAPPDYFAPFIDRIAAAYGKESVDLARHQIKLGLNAPLTSSCGRLFDAMAALLDICTQANYEGQAAMQLERCAVQAATPFEHCAVEAANEPPGVRSCLAHANIPAASGVLSAYPCRISKEGPSCIVDTQPMLLAAYCDLLLGIPRTQIALRFHHAIARIVLDMCEVARELLKLETVCLGGGVFQNKLLLSLTQKLLRDAAFEVYFPQAVPANDGGLSLGQAAVALAQTNSIV